MLWWDNKFFHHWSRVCSRLAQEALLFWQLGSEVCGQRGLHTLRELPLQRLRWGKPGFIFVRTVFVQNEKCSPFSQAHSHASTNATRRHEYFRGLSRLWPVPGVLVSFLELHFLGKMDLLALRGRPQPLKKPSQSQKGHFYEKMNALNDAKTAELSKSAECNGEYLWSSVAFVEAWIKSSFPTGKIS